ncbi:MAG: hypothetical protein ABSG89_05810 [Bacteroidales bacterium]|jgi:ElaB/YqjD/DUF883 family membrane-anchored ribosome-binding protein
MENGKQEQEETGKKNFLKKAKKLVSKADDAIDENVEKLKKSKAFEKVTDAMNLAGDYVEEKVESVKQGKLKQKLDEIADKAEDLAGENISKAKVAGKKIAGKAADKLENIAKDIRNKTKDDPKTDNPA